MSFKDVIIGILCVGLFASLYTGQTEKQQGTSYEQIEQNIVRAQTKILNEVTLPALSKELEKRIEKNNVKMVGYIKNVVGGVVVDKYSNNDKTTIKYGFEKKDLFWIDNEGEKFPIGSLMWSKNRQKWKGLSYKLLFDTNIIQQQNYDGTIETFVETWATHNNLKAKHGGGGRYPVEIVDARFQIKKNDQLVWSFWNPTISGGIYSDLSVNAFIAKFNFINYGYEKSLPVYSFLSPVVLFNGTTIDVGLEIGSYNIGEVVPLLKDAHVGVGILSDYKPFVSFTSMF